MLLKWPALYLNSHPTDIKGNMKKVNFPSPVYEGKCGKWFQVRKARAHVGPLESPKTKQEHCHYSILPSKIVSYYFFFA